MTEEAGGRRAVGGAGMLAVMRGACVGAGLVELEIPRATVAGRMVRGAVLAVEETAAMRMVLEVVVVVLAGAVAEAVVALCSAQNIAHSQPPSSKATRWACIHSLTTVAIDAEAARPC